MLKTCLTSVIAVLLASTAVAQTEVDLPTSREKPLAQWAQMNPQSFRLDDVQLRSQCDRVATLEKDDWFPPEKCAILVAKFLASDYEVVMVPDGILFNYLNGLREGDPYVYRGFEKKLGEENRALLFDLGEGMFAYWFVGDADDGSCHNLGLVLDIERIPKEETRDPEESEPEYETVWICENIPKWAPGIESRTSSSPGTLVEWCDDHVFVGGTSTTWAGTVPTTGSSRKCWSERRRIK